MARWNQSGLITPSGDVFYPDQKTLPTDLPVFIGSKENSKAMIKSFETFSNVLRPLDLHISELRLTSTKVWSIRLDNGTNVTLGRDNLVPRLTRFERVYSKIFGDKVAASVDLRYPHGLAVKWQQ